MTVLPIALIAGVAVATTAWGVLGLVLLIAALLGVAAFFYLRHRMNRDLPIEDDLPPLLFPAPAGTRAAPPASSSPTRVTAAAAPQVMPAPSERTGLRKPAGPAPGRAALPPEPAIADEGIAAGEEVRVGQVHFHRPPEGTLQLLPGRLEILAGTDRVDEIRFLKLPGREASVTFGRSRGEPHAHVQLEAPTVSRMHARMVYQGGRWRIANLSQTNPILVNGEQLPQEATASVLLEDGDRVEMGQVVFRFRIR